MIPARTSRPFAAGAATLVASRQKAVQQPAEHARHQHETKRYPHHQSEVWRTRGDHVRTSRVFGLINGRPSKPDVEEPRTPCPPWSTFTRSWSRRYNRTFLEEWAYVRLYRSNAERTRLLPEWLHRYNYHRSQTALGGLPPIARVNNLSGNYT
jgi:transposase InsO family protein